MTSVTSSLPKYSLNNLTNVATSLSNGGYDTVTPEPLVVGVISSTSVLLAVLGCIGNVLTIRTFFRMGLREPVNLTLAWLALSDLFFLVSGIANHVAFIFDAVEMVTSYRLWFPVDPSVVYFMANSIGSTSYANTMLITTFITIARCLVVAWPLRYRNFLSWKRTVVALSTFSSISVASMIILVSFLGVTAQFDTRIGTVRWIIWFTPGREIAKGVIFSLRDALLPFMSQIFVGTCVFVMASCLRQASHFRCIHKKHRQVKETYLDHSLNATRLVATVNTGSQLPTSDCLTAAENSPAMSRLAGKDLQIVRQMLVIASVYSVCNMPKVVVNLLEVFLSGFYVGQRYQAWYKIAQVIREFFQTVNATVTFWIYWSFNSKFRNHCIPVPVK